MTRSLTLLALAATAALVAAPGVAQEQDLTVLVPVPQDYKAAKTPWGEPAATWPITSSEYGLRTAIRGASGRSCQAPSR